MNRQYEFNLMSSAFATPDSRTFNFEFEFSAVLIDNMPEGAIVLDEAAVWFDNAEGVYCEDCENRELCDRCNAFMKSDESKIIVGQLIDNAQDPFDARIKIITIKEGDESYLINPMVSLVPVRDGMGSLAIAYVSSIQALTGGGPSAYLTRSSAGRYVYTFGSVTRHDTLDAIRAKIWFAVSDIFGSGVPRSVGSTCSGRQHNKLPERTRSNIGNTLESFATLFLTGYCPECKKIDNAITASMPF